MTNKNSNKYIFSLVFFTMFILNSTAQVGEQGFLNASGSFNKKRFNSTIIGEAAIGVLATAGLQILWYKGFAHARFHYFNDNKEWLNMDKAGHATTAYNISAMQYNLMRWSGVKTGSAIWIGGGTGLLYMTLIEILDGFSQKWGFSKGDMLANISGSALFMVQQSAWKQQKIQLRFSYHNSVFAKYNPEELGKKLPQKMLKDYNGQTYWLSVNLSSFVHGNFPRWLNADLGYGAEGMITAVKDPLWNRDSVGGFIRERKLLFSLDGSFTKNNNAFPGWINIIHIPAAALEWKLQSKRIKGYALYY